MAGGEWRMGNTEKQQRDPERLHEVAEGTGCQKGEGSILGRGKLKKEKRGGEERDRTWVMIFDIFIMITGMVPMMCTKPSRMGEGDRWQEAGRAARGR